MSSPDTLTYTGCAYSGDYIIYALFSSPKKQTLDLNKYIFVCDFEVDYCGLALFGTWHRGLKTETQDTGPSRGASNSCKPIYRTCISGLQDRPSFKIKCQKFTLVGNFTDVRPSSVITMSVLKYTFFSVHQTIPSGGVGCLIYDVAISKKSSIAEPAPFPLHDVILSSQVDAHMPNVT